MLVANYWGLCCSLRGEEKGDDEELEKGVGVAAMDEAGCEYQRGLWFEKGVFVNRDDFSIEYSDPPEPGTFPDEETLGLVPFETLGFILLIEE